MRDMMTILLLLLGAGCAFWGFDVFCVDDLLQEGVLVGCGGIG
jgi:hypothetical protein